MNNQEQKEMLKEFKEKLINMTDEEKEKLFKECGVVFEEDTKEEDNNQHIFL